MSLEVPDAMPVYLILGSAGSGRRALANDLAAHVVESPGAKVVLGVHRDEFPDEEVMFPGPVVRYSLGLAPAPAVLELDVPPESVAFVLGPGDLDPIDFVEGAAGWLGRTGRSLGRVLAVVDCGRAYAHPKVLQWWDACLYYADHVLLSHRGGVPNKWISEFQRRYTDQAYPLRFEFLKDGRVRNPAAVLMPEARRIASLFDVAEEEGLVGDDIVVIEETEEGQEVERRGSETVDDDEGGPPPDPYLPRHANGQRMRPLPDLRQHPRPDPGKDASAGA